MIHHSTTIINLAIDKTDDRTRHLTDQIYHIVTFSALTLSQLVHRYESRLQAESHDIEALDTLIVKLINWLRSIGLPCHTASMLSDIVLAHFVKLRPGFRPMDVSASYEVGENIGDFDTLDYQSLPLDVALLYPDFIGSELFDMDAGVIS
ncbi:hypothetical protein EYZ11_000283 [Aspergillus tanneri]|nr:hypothetical protein EYZ11_000283 [Aspergillus tanneri]